MYIIIETTTDSKKIATKISNNLISSKLASCVHLTQDIQSEYIWHGKINQSNEFLIRIKTKKYLYEKVYEIIKKVHNYDNFECISYKFDIISNKYKTWFDNSLV